mmetsp:Transcript_13638/g.39110  ORF Transcript_13638/g.39110 Transcript_13638/m.39110 type:complete len:168 (+) Transcript_13638:474-977(+)
MCCRHWIQGQISWRNNWQLSIAVVETDRECVAISDEVEEGFLEEDSRADTTLLGQGWKVQNVHDCTCTVSGFSSDLGEMTTSVVDATAVAETTRGDSVVLRINQALHKPDEQRSLLSTYQARYNGTRVDSTPPLFDDKSLFGIVLPGEDNYDSIIRFDVRHEGVGTE